MTPGLLVFYGSLHLEKNVQFLGSGLSFSVTTTDRRFILGIHLYLGKTNRKQRLVSDVDLCFMVLLFY